MLSDHASDFSDVGIVNFDLGVVASCDAVHEVVCFLEETHGVEGCEAGFRVDFPEHVEDGHAVDGEG